jgi:hypothetical protein
MYPIPLLDKCPVLPTTFMRQMHSLVGLLYGDASRASLTQNLDAENILRRDAKILSLTGAIFVPEMKRKIIQISPPLFPAHQTLAVILTEPGNPHSSKG